MLKNMLTKLRPTIKPLLDVIAKPLLSIHPNIISWICLLFPILFFLFTISGQYILALIMLFLTPLDAIDGYVAKKTGKVSQYGEFLDATLDRISDSLIIAAFAVSGIVSWEIVAPTLILNLLISYARAKSELASKATLKLEEGLIERPDRILILGLALLAQIIFPNMIISGYTPTQLIFIALLISSAFTLYQRFKLAKKVLR